MSERCVAAPVEVAGTAVTVSVNITGSYDSSSSSTGLPTTSTS
jgi:hypothetical protein